MYESFYGLKEKPFSLLPDPAYLYLSKQHEMAITLLRYSLESQAGFCVISGKAGTGKTTLLRRLLNQIGDDVSVGLISNTHHSFGELLRWILHAFGLEDAGISRAERHQVFTDYLIAQYAKNRRTMLIIDEAQNMAADALEELRMLSNINSEKDLLLQVILVGQPPLRDILRRPELEQFAQRIAVDYHLDVLDLEETRCYIRHRIVIAGGEHELFTEDACDAIYEYCGGNPRLINLLCDLSLVYAYASQGAVVTGELVEQVVTEREKYGALPLFASVNKAHARQDLPARVAQTSAMAMTPVAAMSRAAHKAVALRTPDEARGATPAQARNETTRLQSDALVGNSDRAGKISPTDGIPAATGSRARKVPSAMKAHEQAGAARVSPEEPKQESSAGPLATAETTATKVRKAAPTPSANDLEAVTQVVKSIAMPGYAGKPHKTPGSKETERASARTTVTAADASAQKPGDHPAPPWPAERDRQANAGSPARNTSARSDRTKLPGARAIKSSNTTGGIAAGNRGRPVSEQRRHIPAVVVVGLLLTAPLVLHFVKQQSASIRAALINASPVPAVAVVPVAVATPAKVTPSNEPPVVVPSPKEMSPVNKQETEAETVKTD